MKFRKRLRLFPGVTLNFSGSGVSTTMGIPGASVNIGKKGAYLNTGIPGTGLYDRQRIDKPSKASSNRSESHTYEATGQRDLSSYLHEYSLSQIESGPVSELTSPGLEKLKDELIQCHEQHSELSAKVSTQHAVYLFTYLIELITYVLVFGFFWKKAHLIRKEQHELLLDLKELLSLTYVEVNLKTNQNVIDAYLKLRDKYEILSQSQRIWDVTSTARIDRASTRSAASTAITPKPVKFGFKSIEYLKMDYAPIHFQNANGGDLYLYPGFLVIYISKTNFALIELHKFNMTADSVLFMEESSVPKDAEIHSHTWAKVNKDGSRDKRFKDNHQIPVCKYGKISLQSSQGLNEEYMISSYEKTKMFMESYNAFKRTFATN